MSAPPWLALGAYFALFTVFGCAGEGPGGPSGEPTSQGLGDDPAVTAQAEDGLPMAFPRVYHTATRLPNGMVLLAGGVGDDGVLGATEIYDPGDGSGRGHFSRGPDLKTPRYHHTATAYRGCVVLAGGVSNVGPIAEIEVFRSDPREGDPCHEEPLQSYDALYQSAVIESLPSMARARALHTATAMGAATEPESGEAAAIVFVGGVGPGGDPSPLVAIEVLDMLTETIATEGNLARARREHGATAFPSVLSGPLDRVVIAGGRESAGPGGCADVATIEVLARGDGCPDDGVCVVGSGGLQSARVRPTVSPLLAGASAARVVVAGGHTCEGQEPDPAARVELFEVSPSGVVSRGDIGPPSLSQDGHSVTRFPASLCDRALSFFSGADGIERLDPSLSLPAFAFADTMKVPRTDHVATLLLPATEKPSCRVLFTGGKAASDGTIVGRAEVYEDACRSLEPCAGAFACRSGVCLTRCTSELDCDERASCTPTGECSFAAPKTGPRGGCGAAPRSGGDPSWMLGVMWLLAGLRGRSRR